MAWQCIVEGRMRYETGPAKAKVVVLCDFFSSVLSLSLFSLLVSHSPVACVLQKVGKESALWCRRATVQQLRGPLLSPSCGICPNQSPASCVPVQLSCDGQADIEVVRLGGRREAHVQSGWGGVVAGL